VVVIGAGPAGLAAAMQLVRQGQRPLVLERDRVGGLLWNANLVENYPGFPGGIRGPSLVDRFQEQASSLGVQIEVEEAWITGYDGDCFRIGTNRRELKSQIVVAATGTKARLLPEALISPECKDRVFSEVYPLLEVRKRRIIIIGAGDAAFDYALNLADKNEVIILNRGVNIKALPLLVQRSENHPAISYLSETTLKAVTLEPDSSLRFDIQVSGQLESLTGDYLIGAVGREPDTNFATEDVITKIFRAGRESRLYQIGDLQNGLHRQTAIAVGDGIRAAMEIGHYLNKEAL